MFACSVSVEQWMRCMVEIAKSLEGWFAALIWQRNRLLYFVCLCVCMCMVVCACVRLCLCQRESVCVDFWADFCNGWMTWWYDQKFCISSILRNSCQFNIWPWSSETLKVCFHPPLLRTRVVSFYLWCGKEMQGLWGSKWRLTILIGHSENFLLRGRSFFYRVPNSGRASLLGRNFHDFMSARVYTKSYFLGHSQKFDHKPRTEGQYSHKKITESKTGHIFPVFFFFFFLLSISAKLNGFHTVSTCKYMYMKYFKMKPIRNQ